MSPEQTNVAEATDEQPEVQPAGAPPEDEKPGESAAPEAGKAEPEKETPGEEEVDEEGKPKKEGGFVRRIRKLNARIAAKEEEAEYWRQQALRTAAPAEPKVEEKPKPKQEDFALGDGTYDHAAFTEAVAAWTADQAVRKYAAEQEAKAKETQARTEVERQAKEYRERETAFAQTVEDWDEVTEVAAGILQQQYTPALRSISTAILDSERGPELLYYLGQNPEEAQRIAKLSPTRAVMALGQLEARLAEQEEENPGKAEKTPPPVSHAPKPPTPIRKPSGGAKLRPDDPADAEKMSTEEWRKARDEQERQRIRAQRGK